jgi:hypothetical protein
MACDDEWISLCLKHVKRAFFLGQLCNQYISWSLYTKEYIRKISHLSLPNKRATFDVALIYNKQGGPSNGPTPFDGVETAGVEPASVKVF